MYMNSINEKEKKIKIIFWYRGIKEFKDLTNPELQKISKI